MTDSSAFSVGLRVLSLLGNELVLLGFAEFLSQKFLSSQGLGVGIQLDQNPKVSQGVLLSLNSLDGFDNRPDSGLNFIGVDDSGKIGVGHAGSGEGITALVDGLLVEGSVKGI